LVRKDDFLPQNGIFKDRQLPSFSAFHDLWAYFTAEAQVTYNGCTDGKLLNIGGAQMESLCLLHNKIKDALDKCPEHTPLPLEAEVPINVKITCLTNIQCGTCVHFEDMRRAIKKDAERDIEWAVKLIKELEG
jgi:hypothetical protein